ncbi:hypothetical protein NX021_15255 [Cytobacillus firmus]|nr:hypothetical protein [Cytobacillus firmus]
MKSKLDILADDENFGLGALGCQTGLMMNQYNDVVTYLFLAQEGYFEVYLSLFDEEHEPLSRDILAEGIAPTLEEAKAIAVKNLNEEAYGIKIL